MFGVESEKRLKDISRNRIEKQRGYRGTAKSNITTYFKQSILHRYRRFMFEPVIIATYQKEKS
jgi:hypothetical protein